jgi:PqqD family protein of HPr-rel-A system
MTFSDSTCFMVAAGEAPQLRRFADEAVVFNPLTGHTHLLAGPMVSVLEAIIGSEQSLPAVTRLFRDHSPAKLTPLQAEEYLGNALAELVGLDLIRVAGERGD